MGCLWAVSTPHRDSISSATCRTQPTAQRMWVCWQVLVLPSTRKFTCRNFIWILANVCYILVAGERDGRRRSGERSAFTFNIMVKSRVWFLLVFGFGLRILVLNHFFSVDHDSIPYTGNGFAINCSLYSMSITNQTRHSLFLVFCLNVFFFSFFISNSFLLPFLFPIS